MGSSGTHARAAVGGANLFLRFLLELAMVAAYGTWGVMAFDAAWLRVLFGLGAPALALLVWAAFVAPRAKRRLADPARLVVEAALFALAALALATVGLMPWAIALALVAAVNTGILQAMRLR